MNNQTSSVKIYERRNGTYQLGEELEFKIPPTVSAMNPLETYFTCNVEITGAGAQLALNKQCGAELLVIMEN